MQSERNEDRSREHGRARAAGFHPRGGGAGSERTGKERVDGKAEFVIAGTVRDPGTIAARSAGIGIGLAIDDAAHAALRRDGLDPAALRLTGLHPFEFAPLPEGGMRVTAHANDNETAEALLDLFRVYFLGRLLA